MKIIFILFLSIFLISCGKVAENKLGNAVTGNTEKSEEISDKKRYTLVILEQSPENIAGFDVGYTGNLKFFEKTEDGEGEIEYNMNVLLKEGKVESFIVAFIPKENDLSKTIGFDDKMHDLAYNASDKIAV